MFKYKYSLDHLLGITEVQGHLNIRVDCRDLAVSTEYLLTTRTRIGDGSFKIRLEYGADAIQPLQSAETHWVYYFVVFGSIGFVAFCLICCSM